MYSMITEQKLISVAHKNHKQEGYGLKEGIGGKLLHLVPSSRPGAFLHTWFETTELWVLVKLKFLQEIYFCLNQ